MRNLVPSSSFRRVASRLHTLGKPVDTIDMRIEATEVCPVLSNVFGKDGMIDEAVEMLCPLHKYGSIRDYCGIGAFGYPETAAHVTCRAADEASS